ncbi:hypothetical protein AMTR_s00771p00009430, partial [Amborella trichopoda]
MGELVNLRHLDLSYTSDLEEIEYGLISRLTNLEELDMYESRYILEMEMGGAKWEELEGLKRLKSLGTFIILDVKFLNMPVVETMFSHLRKLYLCKYHGLTNFYHISAMTSLKTLYIDGCLDLTWLDIGRGPSLEWLELYELPMLKNIRSFDVPIACHHNNLRRVAIICCDRLINVFPSVAMSRLQNLELIQIITCNSIEEIITGAIEDSRLPKLRDLNLTSLHSLMSVGGSVGAWSSLEVIQVTDCHNLKKLPA